MSNDIDTLREALQTAQDTIAEQNDVLGRLLADPMVHATVVKATNDLDPNVFLGNDLVLIVDADHKLCGRTARLMGAKGKPCVNTKNGTVEVMLPDASKCRFNIGLNNQPPQIKLLGKNDGTNVILSAGGELHEVFGLFGHKFGPGDAVKVNLKTKQIVEAMGTPARGAVAHVLNVIDHEHVEVDSDNHRMIVFNTNSVQLETGDRVELDRFNTLILRRLAREDSSRHVLSEDVNVSWDDIGGCEEAKEAMAEAIELPYKHPEVYKFYNKKLPKGVLLYGPPGCGKTLIGKATATSLTKQFGKDWRDTGFILVKGPELLSMWVGMAEHNIRNLFMRARKHFEAEGCPAVIFIDEAEAILPTRGSGRSSDVEKTIVPMFLSEMDGIETSYAIIILATNRPEMLDPAVIRPGRIDRHIKVPRPTEEVSQDILKIHMRDIPFSGTDIKEAAKKTAAKLYDKELVLFKATQGGRSELFRLSDCLNGAIVANVVEQASTMAMKEDLKAGKQTGMKIAHLEAAVENVFRSQLDQPNEYDLKEFYEAKKMQKSQVKLEKAAIV